MQMSMHTAISNIWQNRFKFIKYAVIGGSSGGTGMFLLWTMVNSWKIEYLIANVLAFIWSTSVGYLGNWLWTFKEKHKHLLYKQYSYPMYLSLCAINLIVVQGVSYLLVYHFGVFYMVATFLTGVILVPTNYLISKTWVFRKAKV